MNNTIDFVLRMRDMMSAGLGRLASTSQSSFSRMSQHVKQHDSHTKILGMSYDALQNRIRDVESTVRSSTIPSQIAFARRELEALQRQALRHPGNISQFGSRSSMSGPKSSGGGLGIGDIAVGSMVGNAAMEAGSQLTTLIRQGIGTMIEKTFSKEQAITGLSTFLGKEGATTAYNNIRKDADITPFDTESLLEVNRSLISAGLLADAARKDTMNLANAVSAVGGGNEVLARMAANMQQIKTVGKATAMDIRQFGIAGINIYEMLARSTGKNINQVKEMDVSYEQLSQALAMAAGKGGIYEGALEAQSKTMAGKWSTVQDKFGNALVDLGDAFAPVFNKFLDLGIGFVNRIAPMLQTIQPYIDMISNGISQAVDFVMNLSSGTSEWSDWIALVQEYWMMIWGIVKMLAVKIWALVASILDWIKKSELLKDIFAAVIWMIEKLWKLVGWIIDGIMWLWENVLKPILEAIDAVYKWIKGGDDIKVKATKTIVTKKPKPDDKPAGAMATATSMASTNAASGQDAGSAVTGSGPKVINIQVGKFFDSINFTTMNGGESAQELERIVLECLARVLYQGAKTVT